MDIQRSCIFRQLLSSEKESAFVEFDIGVQLQGLYQNIQSPLSFSVFIVNSLLPVDKLLLI
ncbi:hypothetical protein SDC9_116974 [bioreactor metagenome]|uniref:Uncharacterized protein n=1 Tax=bioreactor metagenome TaxID=1076179 RepID=A0A645C3V1_9ZZZZ